MFKTTTMRKLVLTLLLAASFTGLYAQKMDDIKEKIQKGKYAEAKEKLDKVMTDPKAQSNSEAWFYKAQIYHNLAKATPTDTALAAASLDAMNHYLTLEAASGSKGMIMSQIEGNKTFFDIYQGYFTSGVNSFKTKDYQTALYNFEKGLETFGYLSKYNFTPVKFDTTTTIYAALAAHNAKNYPTAAKYYGEMVNNRVNDTSYVDAYEFLISYNLSETKDT